MRFIVEDDKGLRVALEIGESGAKIINGDNYIGDILRSTINNRELKHQSEIDLFPKELIYKNDMGVIQLKTESYEYLHKQLPKLEIPYGLTVTEEHD